MVIYLFCNYFKRFYLCQDLSAVGKKNIKKLGNYNCRERHYTGSAPLGEVPY